MNDWLICFSGGEEGSGTEVYSFKGTDNEVKLLLVEEIKNLREYYETEPENYTSHTKYIVTSAYRREYDKTWPCYWAFISWSRTDTIEITAIPLDAVEPIKR